MSNAPKPGDHVDHCHGAQTKAPPRRMTGPEWLYPVIDVARARSLAFGAIALIAFPLQAAGYSCGGVINDPAPLDDPSAAQPLHSAPEEDGVEPDAAIRAVWSKVDATWNARDAQEFSRLFADDVTFRFVKRGQALDGRTTILEHFRERFPRYSPDLRHHTRISAIHRIEPGVCTADGKVEILHQAPGTDAAPAVLRTFAIFAVMSAKDRVWSIRSLRVYQLPATAGDAD